MRRLLIKELRSAWWIIAGAYAVVIVLVLIGSPLAFRGGLGDTSYDWLIIPFLLLGLRAYSGELSAGTVEFIYSRPIKWWKVLLAKLIVGVSAIVSTVGFGLLMYVLTAPKYYLPFLHESVLGGLTQMIGTFSLAFAFGFAASVLMPGVALSFIGLIGIGVGLGILTTITDWIARTYLISSLKEPVVALGIAVIFGAVASILIARKLPRLGIRERWVVMGRLLAAGFAIGLVFAAFGWLNETKVMPSPMSLSPDGRLAIYTKENYSAAGKLVLVDVRTGQVEVVIPSRDTMSFTWSPDSRKVAFTSDGKTIAIITAGPKPESWKARTFASGGWNYTTWSPDSQFLAVRHEQSGEFVSTKTEYLLVDIGRKTVRTIKPKMFDRYEDVVPGNAPVYVEGHGLFWPPVVK